MIKIIYCCDGCGKEMEPTGDMLKESQVKEWDMRGCLFCETCAAKIDNTILRFKLECLEAKK